MSEKNIPLHYGDKVMMVDQEIIDAIKRQSAHDPNFKIQGPYQNGKPPVEAFHDEELRRLMDTYLPRPPADPDAAETIRRLLKTLNDWDIINRLGVFTAKVLHRGPAKYGTLQAGAIWCGECQVWYESGRVHLHESPQCDHDWQEAVHVSTGSAWDHADRFEFCVKCRTARDKQ